MTLLKKLEANAEVFFMVLILIKRVVSPLPISRRPTQVSCKRNPFMLTQKAKLQSTSWVQRRTCFSS